jgi:hypothetical protein
MINVREIINGQSRDTNYIGYKTQKEDKPNNTEKLNR